MCIRDSIVTHAVTANALEESVLHSLGLRNFNIVVVSIGQDIQANILVTLMLKEMGVTKVVAKATTELHGSVLPVSYTHLDVYKRQ